LRRIIFAKWLATGERADTIYGHTMLTALVNGDHIEPGNYVIEVFW
jgi:hypothetical protein